MSNVSNEPTVGLNQVGSELSEQQLEELMAEAIITPIVIKKARENQEPIGG